MAGIGDRMGGDNDILVWRDGNLIDVPGAPVPDDETLARLEKRAKEHSREFPVGGGVKVGPLHYRRRTPED